MKHYYYNIILTILEPLFIKKLKRNEIIQGGQWELKDLTNSKPIKPLTTPSKIIQHIDGIIQIKFSPISKYSFNQYFIFAGSSISNTNLNSVDFTQKNPIPLTIKLHKSLSSTFNSTNNKNFSIFVYYVPRGKIGETSKSIFSSTLSSSSSYYAKSLDQPFIIPINAAKSNIQLVTPI